MEQKKPQRHNEEPARIEYVDFFKVLALFCIFLAHVGPPEWVIALRCFDVPLMVILSAMLGERSYARKKAASSSFSASATTAWSAAATGAFAKRQNTDAAG